MLRQSTFLLLPRRDRRASKFGPIWVTRDRVSVSHVARKSLPLPSPLSVRPPTGTRGDQVVVVLCSAMIIGRASDCVSTSAEISLRDAPRQLSTLKNYSHRQVRAIVPRPLLSPGLSQVITVGQKLLSSAGCPARAGYTLNVRSHPRDGRETSAERSFAPTFLFFPSVPPGYGGVRDTD